MSVEEKALPQELKETSFFKYKFIRIGTISGGSCLLHAIYFAINKSNYKSQNTEGKTEIVKNQRIRLALEYRKLADLYAENKPLPDKFGSGMFDILLNQDNKKHRESFMTQHDIIRANEKIIEDYNEFLSLEIINLVSYLEKKEIALVDISKEYSYSNFKCYKSGKIIYPNIVFILIKKDNKHYEPLVIKETSGNFTGEFKTESTLSKELLTVCDVNDEIFIKSGRKNNLSDFNSNTNRFYRPYINVDRKLRHNNVYDRGPYVAPYNYNYNSDRRRNYTLFPNNYYTYTGKYNTSYKSDKQITVGFSTIILVILFIMVFLILYSSYY